MTFARLGFKDGLNNRGRVGLSSGEVRERSAQSFVLWSSTSIGLFNV